MKEAIKILTVILLGLLFFTNLYLMNYFNVQNLSIDKIIFSFFNQIIISFLWMLSIRNLNN